MFFDPLCPWAWMTSRWLMEVAEVRNLDITWSVMSLSALNEGRDGLSESYRGMLDSGWGPVRVVIAAARDHGDKVKKQLYDAMGARLHPGGRGDTPDDLRQVIVEALEDVGLPPELIDCAANVPGDEIDIELRASHQRAMDLVGDEVGTPVVSVGDVAFFGPVVTPAPKGEAAGQLWDGCLLVAGTPGFYEIKRTRVKGPDFS
ncbi:disulfide bond formation protein DsbA [Leekyejoonella antrihumi]|nr:disulfide bond formation protein DsbA [Leekyejoonella antrihumi]